MEEQNVGSSGFKYQIAARPPFAVVLFHGALSRAVGEMLEKCAAELLASDAKFLVFSFNDAHGLERPLIAPLVRMQKQLRDKGRELRICDLKAETYKTLIESAAVREGELCESLQEALKSFRAASTRAAA